MLDVSSMLIQLFYTAVSFVLNSDIGFALSPFEWSLNFFLFFTGNNEAGHMVLNQTFTIEPMLTIGSRNAVMWDDNWTVVTEDASLSAQFEHTILITKDGAEILTTC